MDACEILLENAKKEITYPEPVCNGHRIPDGEFGPATERAVKSFQHLHGLIPNGEIGAETWTKLLMT